MPVKAKTKYRKTSTSPVHIEQWNFLTVYIARYAYVDISLWSVTIVYIFRFIHQNVFTFFRHSEAYFEKIQRSFNSIYW